MNLPGASASIFDRNKFLAEDRILAFGKLIPPTSGLIHWSFLVSILDIATARPLPTSLTYRNRDQETSEMEITIREICESRYRCPINGTRIHLSTKKMA